VATPKPVPPAAHVLPLAPVTEEFHFLTSVSMTLSSREQRNRLRAAPRQRYSHNLHLRDDADWRMAFAEMYKYQNQEYLHPLYHYWTRLTAQIAPNETELYFDPSQTDLRDGESLAIFDVFTRKVTFHEIDEVTSTGAILTEPVGRLVDLGHCVCPALPCRMTDIPQLEKFERLGEARVTLETTRPRRFRRELDLVLPTLQGTPVVANEPYGRVGEAMNRGGAWLDGELSVPVAWNTWRHGGRVSGNRSYYFDRFEDMDYWRAVLDYMGGRQRTVFIPSYYDDLPLTEQPALNSTSITTTEVQVYEMFQLRMFSAVSIFRQNGLIHRAIVSAVMNYAPNGDPVSVTLNLDTSIGNQPGSNVISKVSLLYQMRLKDDRVRMEHHQNHSTVTLNLESVYQ